MKVRWKLIVPCAISPRDRSSPSEDLDWIAKRFVAGSVD